MVQNLSKDYTALLDGMILKFGEKKVELFFIVPYMADNQFPLVDTNRVIYLYDPVSNPGKYMAHDFFDHAHLNQAGANLNSVQISAEIRKKFRDSHILPVIWWPPSWVSLLLTRPPNTCVQVVSLKQKPQPE